MNISHSKPIQGDLFDQLSATVTPTVDPPKVVITEAPRVITEPKTVLPQNPKNYYQIALGITVAAIVAFLEVYYYYYRFSMDGLSVPLALISGVGLTGFLLVTYLQKMFWLYIPLVIFSVFATSAGQSYALAEDARQQALNAAVVLERSNVITDLEGEKNRLSVALAGIVIPKSMDVRRRYAEEVEKALEEKAGYEVELTQVNAKLEDLRPQAVGIGKRETSYDFYAGLLGIKAEWIQVFIHTVLSVFISFMAPVSIKKLVLD